MPFLNKNLRSNPSLVKPIIIAIAVLLVIGGAYAFLGEKKPNNPTEAAVPPAPEAPKAEINPSGLDKDMRVKNVEDAEKVIEKWIAANPKAIIDSVNNMQKKMMEEQTKNAQKTIGTKLNELFADTNSPEYAPAGYDVSIVEFFDYSCGYCKKANGTVEELLQSDKKVRIIYKEFPILGQPSHEMTEVAFAIQLVEPASYKKFHDAMMKSSERGKDAAIKIAKSVGISGAKLEASLKNNKDKITGMIQANLVLGNSIGINGTPGFVIGEELIPGALEIDALKAKIAEVRAKK